MVKNTIFLVLAIASFFLSPVIALFLGIISALFVLPKVDPRVNKVSKYLLQISVVGLGFGMNIHEALKSSTDGMLITIGSVAIVMLMGVMLGKAMKLDKKLSYLVASGTAICGGSAIAAISPSIKANSNQTTMALAVIFTLNAIALLIFPTIGHWFGLTQQQFGTWAAIAIHDTSSVVGAAEIYGEEALNVATTVKLTRALWIIPLSFVSMLIFRTKEKKVSIPWFIFLFVIAMLINTYVHIDARLIGGIGWLSHRLLSLTLFLIGSTLSVDAVKSVGAKPVVMGVILWFVISVFSFVVTVSL